MKIMDSAEFDKVNVFGKGTENTAYAKYFIRHVVSEPADTEKRHGLCQCYL